MKYLQNKYIIFLICLVSYIFVPFLLQGVLIFYLIHILLVFGTLLMIDNLISKFPQFVNKNILSNNSEEIRIKDKVRGYNFFIFDVLAS